MPSAERFIGSFPHLSRADAKKEKELEDADKLKKMVKRSHQVLAHVRKHLYQGRELDRERLAEELGDVLWCVAAVATMCDLDLSTVARLNQEKLAARHP